MNNANIEEGGARRVLDDAAVFSHYYEDDEYFTKEEVYAYIEAQVEAGNDVFFVSLLFEIITCGDDDVHRDRRTPHEIWSYAIRACRAGDADMYSWLCAEMGNEWADRLHTEPMETLDMVVDHFEKKVVNGEHAPYLKHITPLPLLAATDDDEGLNN